jgi:hypothetical protein
MAGPASHDEDYHRGEMDISEQASTFDLVMGLSKWGALGIAVLVLFFTMWLYPRGSFMGAAVAAVVLLVAGIFFLRSKPAH